MAEQIRLVIWDLDETFWRGTVTEGGHSYVRAHHDLVIALAARGIVSSICSKNDFETVKAILVAEGLWDYFIFPSINWYPKGPRVATIVEATQLRAPTVLFVDDNPMNLNEAKHYVPDIQTADETIVARMLGDPLFAGKNDSELTRLKQYKLLERRKEDEQKSPHDPGAFLRSCNIKVSIEHNVGQHLDRVVELVNRTNQLNYTKNRFSESPEEARRELQEFLRSFRMQVGLVRVTDDYGDYGYCGFYAFDVMGKQLVHFCFSCRTLGMFVEAWLYDRLGRPSMQIRGEVLTDLSKRREIDWITYVDRSGHGAVPVRQILGRVYMRGGCDLTAAGHYLSMVSESITGEYNVIRGANNLRLDHSIFLRYAVAPVSAEGDRALTSIGYDSAVRQSAFPDIVAETDIFVFSFGTDANYSLYRDRKTGMLSTFQIDQINNRQVDIGTKTDAELDELLPQANRRSYAAALKSNFEFTGLVTRDMFFETIGMVMDRIGPKKPVFIFQALERQFLNGRWLAFDHQIELNRRLAELPAIFQNIKIVNLRDCIEDESEILDPVHFNRKVYYRMHQKIVDHVKEMTAEPAERDLVSA